LAINLISKGFWQSPSNHQFKTTKEKTMKNNLKSFTISAFLASSLGVMAVSIPNSFTAGQPIKAADVNANFSSLKTAVDMLEALPQISVPFLLTGTGGGISKGTLQASNTNTGIAAVFSQTKTGASDAVLVIGQAGNGPLIKGFGVNGGEDDFRVDSNGTVTLLKPDNTPNITLNNATGAGIFSGTVTANGVLLTSDRNAKKNFSSVNSLSILEKVVKLPISSWNYKTDANNLRHIGPMAQDFQAAFGLNGTDKTHISSIDEQGVALAAIKGLNQKLEQRNAKIKQLESKLATFEARLTALERK
jgi:Chaperone of endosialidase